MVSIGKRLLPISVLFLSSLIGIQRMKSWIKLNMSIQNYAAFSAGRKRDVPQISERSEEILQRYDVMKVLNDYKREHSSFALREEASSARDTSRKFAVGYYSCPLQAGNRLHHFMNSLIWAVVTNRTLLWKYYDKKTCGEVGTSYAHKICGAANSVRDCDKILKRAEWLPAFDQWSPKLNLSIPLSLSYWTTHEPSKKHKFWFDGAESEAGRADSTESVLIDFPQMLGQDSWILHSERKRKMLLTSAEAQGRAEQLFRAGTDYLYGHLFYDCFSFQPSVSIPVFREHNYSKRINSTKELHSPFDESSENITVVLHSRHSSISDAGTKISREAHCLDQLLKGVKGFCQVMLLSDRPKTLTAVREYLYTHHSNCHVLIAPHDIGFSFSKEHGPFSGSGFYQDLAMVSNQTLHVPTTITAFIGSKHRSSSELVRELMTFQIGQQTGIEYTSANLTTCFLEDT